MRRTMRAFEYGEAEIRLWRVGSGMAGFRLIGVKAMPDRCDRGGVAHPCRSRQRGLPRSAGA